MPMSNFVIEFRPALPPAPGSQGDISLKSVQVDKVLNAFPQPYDVWYDINGSRYCYYPTSILTMLNDIHLEWELIRKRESHNMTLVGYTVLEMTFTGETICFFDPVERAQGRGEPIGGEFAADVIEKTFKSALDALWSLIRSID
jgi:hypothetical protein